MSFSLVLLKKNMNGKQIAALVIALIGIMTIVIISAGKSQVSNGVKHFLLHVGNGAWIYATVKN